MEFIGQTPLIEKLEANNSRSILVCGPAHWGKKTLLRQFYAKKNMLVYEISGNAQNFRQSLEFIYTQIMPVLYLIPDVDKLHITVQNMLLKVLEEPPLRASFCLTASNYVLPTIRSRCVVFQTVPYSEQEIESCLDGQDIYAEYGDSPGRCNLIRQYLDFSQPASADLPDGIRSLMYFIRDNLKGNLALLLVKANEIGKVIKDLDMDYFVFYLLARKIYAGYESLFLLSSNIDSLDRYLMIQFYMQLWKEAQCR